MNWRKAMPVVAVLCMVLAGCTIAKSPPKNIPNVVTADIQEDIEKHIEEQTKLGDGYFKIEFDDRKGKDHAVQCERIGGGGGGGGGASPVGECQFNTTSLKLTTCADKSVGG